MTDVRHHPRRNIRGGTTYVRHHTRKGSIGAKQQVEKKAQKEYRKSQEESKRAKREALKRNYAVEGYGVSVSSDAPRKDQPQHDI